MGTGSSTILFIYVTYWFSSNESVYVHIYNLSHGTRDISNLDRKNYTMSSVDLCIDCLLLSRMFCSVEVECAGSCRGVGYNAADCRAAARPINWDITTIIGPR